jgi:beta-1,2-mannobiose phosphorylase / 1,2-beta-oligomannan phosphorylase
MIRRLSEKLLLRPEDLKPLRDDFSVIGVFNPAAVQIGKDILLMVRVAEQSLEQRSGFVAFPRHTPDGTIVLDWIPEEELDQADSRVVRFKRDNLLRLTSISHLRVFRCRDGRLRDWAPGPLFLPASPMEEYGIEDPRITKIEEKYWITYVAVSRHGVATALASTTDWVSFERHGVIFYPENKDVVLFPHQVNGQYVVLHRPNPNSHFSRPEIWLARSPDLLHWGQHECLYGGSAEWESDRIGAGSPPIAIKEGWLGIYHGSRQATRTGDVGTYSAGAMLLDRENPALMLGRSREPIMQPMAEFEQFGFVNNVVFPTALLEQGETLQVFYGAADTYTAVVEFAREDLLAALY